MATKIKRGWRSPVDVDVLGAKLNPMFTPFQTAITKFLRYSQPVRCAYCGRLSTLHWTQLRFFRIAEGFDKKVRGKVVPAHGFELSNGRELFPPLTPVCTKHILAPQMRPAEKRQQQKEKKMQNQNRITPALKDQATKGGHHA